MHNFAFREAFRIQTLLFFRPFDIIQASELACRDLRAQRFDKPKRLQRYKSVFIPNGIGENYGY